MSEFDPRIENDVRVAHRGNGVVPTLKTVS